MDALALTFSSGWASGINSYLVVLVLGIADRVGSFTEIPDVLARWDVLTVAGFLYGYRRIAPAFRARHVVERAVRVLLIA